MTDRYSQIINIAQNDENIRGIFLYGSKANENVIPDKYQDFDIYYIVKDIDKFDFNVFNSVKLLFIPSENYPELFENEHCYLMLFDDDSRIDLVVCTRENFLSKHINENPMKCLLDKDNNLPETDLSMNVKCLIQPINEKLFNATCSEFIWELQNVAKGIKRNELSYTMFIRDIGARDMLNRLIDSYIGMKNNYTVTTGTLGKYRKSYLSKTQYKLYENTYLSNTTEDIWKSLFFMLELFEELSVCLANKYHYHYPKAEATYIKDYLIRVKNE